MIIEELYTRLGFQVDKTGLDRGRQAMERFKASATKLLGGLAVGAGLVTLARTGIQAAMEIENLSAQFKVMTGSAEGAKKILGDIAQFAASTPFDKIGLADAGKTLMAFGLQADEVIPTLRMLGDVAGPSAERLKSLALVFGQIRSAGKLQGQDLLQLINQGFNPLQIIAEKTGRSMADLKDAMAKGAISADMVTLAFKAATSEGGLFYGNLEEQSKTLAGRISTLKDNFVTALQNMAEAFLPMLKAGVDMLVAFDWTPIVRAVQSFGSALASLDFASVAAWVRRLSVLVVAFATRDLQVTFMGALEKGLVAMSGYFQGLMTTFVSFRSLAVGSIKAVGMAMKTALGPIGIALMAIEGFVEAYNWLENRSREKATEALKAQARQYIQQQTAQGRTMEQAVNDQLSQERGREARIAALQADAARGGEAGRRASVELTQQTTAYNQARAFNNALREVYKERTGLEWQVRQQPGMVKDPKLGGDTKALEQAFKDLEKSLDEATKSTNKNTKATKDNTAAKEKPFNVADLARRSFDAQFNVKLKQMIIGAST